jgi:hypothetical protein
MSLPPQLETDVNKLKESGYTVSLQRDGNQVFVVMDHYPVPPGWNKPETTLLLITDIGYPNSKMDMFWTDVDLMLNNGKIAQATEAIQNFLGKQWRRFSWHVQKWNPAVDNLRTYLETVNARLREMR